MSSVPRDATILVVDDDPDVVVVVQETLSRSGYHVLCACDGAEALIVMRGLPVDLVLLDLLMVGMDGWEFFEALSRESGAPKPPVVIMSGSPEALAKTCSELFVDALPKPLSTQALLDVVRRHTRHVVRPKLVRGV